MATSSLSTIRRIRIGRDRTSPLAIMHSPAPALEADDLRVMQKSVEQRAGGGVRPHPMLIRRMVLNERASDLLQPRA